MKTYHSRALGVKVKERAELNELSLVDLTSLFNELTGSELKKFKDKKTAVNRTWKAIESWRERRSNGKGRARRPLNYPQKKATVDGIKRMDGTMYGAIFKLLSRKNGASLEEVADLMKEMGHKPERALHSVRMMHRHFGYGLSEDETGRIRVHP